MTPFSLSLYFFHQFSCLVMSDSLQPHGWLHSRPPCPSPTPGACSNMSIESVMPSNHLLLCHPLLLPLIFQKIRVFSNESVLCISPSNEYSGLISFRIDCSISLQSKGLSRVFSNTTVQKHQFFGAQLSLRSNSQIHT